MLAVEKKILKKIWKKDLDFLAYKNPQATLECPQKIVSPFSPAIWPALGKYIQMSCFII